MIYGEEKVRHLTRNTKSQRSANARDVKLLCNRQHRHRISQQMHDITLDSERWDNDTICTSDTCDGGYIRDCRGSYHSRPIQRWATKVSAGIPKEQRLTHLGSKLPYRISCCNATSWFAWKDAFRWAEHDQRPEFAGNTYRQQQLQERMDMIRRILSVLEIGLQKKLNTAVRQAHWKAEKVARKKAKYERRRYNPNPGDPRLLLGIHDVSTYLEDLIRGTRLDENSQRCGGHHPEWLKAFEQFCERHNIN